jgi:hypothetical protein
MTVECVLAKRDILAVTIPPAVCVTTYVIRIASSTYVEMAPIPPHGATRVLIGESVTIELSEAPVCRPIR